MIFAEFLKALEDHGVRYLIVGGVAVNLHGFPRATGDLDILLALDDENVRGCVAAIRSLGWRPRAPVSIDELADPVKRAQWREEKGMIAFSIYNPRQDFEQVDILLDCPMDFESLYGRCRRMRAENLTIAVAGLDDLIKLKEDSGRKRDLLDIQALKEIRDIRRDQT